MKCQGKTLKWSHVLRLYHLEASGAAAGMKKLKYEQVYLTSFSKMRVDLAAQVLLLHEGKTINAMLP
jgi:hypothetical protein